MNSLTIITIVSLSVIAIVFVVMWVKARKINLCAKTIAISSQSENPLDNVEDEKLRSCCDSYRKTVSIEVDGKKKTNVPSEEIFNEGNVAKAFGINLRSLEAGSGTLVGLGLLGTFLGLTCGIWGFESSNSEQIQSSIQSLLDGMGTAFSTSLLGMTLSIIYTYIEKRYRNNLSTNLIDFNDKLDENYYIDDIELADYNQKKMLNKMFERQQEMMESISSRIQSLLHYANAEGQEVPVANAIREILTNNQEQTRALKSFSTDLALSLNEGFDEVLSRQMQQKILPLMESVDATTKAVIEHIDNMSANLQSPATDMIERVVEELKTSMVEIMGEFKSGLSGSATKELETLAMSMGTATQAMARLPKDMEDISDTLQVTIDEVKTAVAEISKTSASTNDAAMKQMQEQVTFATTAINNAILEVKDVMTSMSQAGAQTVSVITNGITEQQGRIEASQSQLLERFDALVTRFGDGIERVSSVNDSVAGTMNEFARAQAEITRISAHLQSISGDMKTATEVFRKSQGDYSSTLDKLQSQTQSKMVELVDMFEAAGNATDEYAEKFEVVRQGLTQIFSQIQEGLKNYSTTVRTSIQQYLDAYSKNLTETTSNLAAAIESQGEIAEMLAESASKIRR